MGFLKGIRDSINKMNYEQNRINEYKEQWNKKKVIQFKNERIAILLRHSGAQVQFIIAFDDLTREGYRCVAQDEGQSFSMAGFSGGINSFYYFQKIEYVNKITSDMDHDDQIR